MTTVVAAAIVRDKRLLAAQRSHPAELAGKWELPGGKVEPGETDRVALARECREELAIEIRIGERVTADVPTIDGSGVLRVFWAEPDPDREPQPHDHADLRWLTSDQLDDVDWLAADRPVIAAIRHSLET